MNKILMSIIFVYCTSDLDDLMTQDEIKISLCVIEELYYLNLHKACKYFWSKAKKTKSFQTALSKKIEKYNLINDEPIYHLWYKYIVSLAKNISFDEEVDDEENFKFINSSAKNFYLSLHSINQYVDINNLINKLFIRKLLDEMVRAILPGEEFTSLPLFDDEKLKTVVDRSKRLSKELHYHGLDAYISSEKSFYELINLATNHKNLLVEMDTWELDGRLNISAICNVKKAKTGFFYNQNKICKNVLKDYQKNYCFIYNLLSEDVNGPKYNSFVNFEIRN